MTKLTTEEIAGLLALKEGLPEGPWQIRQKGEFWAITPGENTHCIATTYRDDESDAIVAIPSLFAALEQMAREIESLKGELAKFAP